MREIWKRAQSAQAHTRIGSSVNSLKIVAEWQQSNTAYKYYVAGLRMVFSLQTCDITYEKVAAFRLVEWYDDLFMEVL